MYRWWGGGNQHPPFLERCLFEQFIDIFVNLVSFGLVLRVDIEIFIGRFQIKQKIITIYDLNMKACSSQTEVVLGSFCNTFINL